MAAWPRNPIQALERLADSEPARNPLRAASPASSSGLSSPPSLAISWSPGPWLACLSQQVTPSGAMKGSSCAQSTAACRGPRSRPLLRGWHGWGWW